MKDNENIKESEKLRKFISDKGIQLDGWEIYSHKEDLIIDIENDFLKLEAQLHLEKKKFSDIFYFLEWADIENIFKLTVIIELCYKFYEKELGVVLI